MWTIHADDPKELDQNEIQGQRFGRSLKYEGRTLCLQWPLPRASISAGLREAWTISLSSASDSISLLRPTCQYKPTLDTPWLIISSLSDRRCIVCFVTFRLNNSRYRGWNYNTYSNSIFREPRPSRYLPLSVSCQWNLTDSRTCGDCLALNSATIRDPYPIPNLSDCTGLIGGTIIFTPLDLVKAHDHIPLEPSDIPKTDISSPFQLLQYLRMRFWIPKRRAKFSNIRGW